MKIYGQEILVCIGKIPDEFNYDGCYLNDKKQIILNETLTGDNLTQVLLHEFIHACIDRLGWRQFMTHEIEEMVCEQLSVALIENFQVNMIGNKPKKKKGR